MSACVEWEGYVNPHLGYGIEGRNTLAHRAAYERAVGPIPAGFHIHHVCGNRRCVNVDHLRAVSPLEHSHEHRATEACPRCGGTRRRQMFKANGKRNGRRCMDCHSRYETARISRKRAEARA